MIKTYLVPVTDEVIKLMEKGEAPSFLHCATCLDGLTNGEVIQKMFPKASIVEFISEPIVRVQFEKSKDKGFAYFSLDWWNRKFGE